MSTIRGTPLSRHARARLQARDSRLRVLRKWYYTTVSLYRTSLLKEACKFHDSPFSATMIGLRCTFFVFLGTCHRGNRIF